MARVTIPAAWLRGGTEVSSKGQPRTLTLSQGLLQSALTSCDKDKEPHLPPGCLSQHQHQRVCMCAGATPNSGTWGLQSSLGSPEKNPITLAWLWDNSINLQVSLSKHAEVEYKAGEGYEVAHAPSAINCPAATSTQTENHTRMWDRRDLLLRLQHIY